MDNSQEFNIKRERNSRPRVFNLGLGAGLKCAVPGKFDVEIAADKGSGLTRVRADLSSVSAVSRLSSLDVVVSLGVLAAQRLWSHLHPHRSRALQHRRADWIHRHHQDLLVVPHHGQHARKNTRTHTYALCCWVIWRRRNALCNLVFVLRHCVRPPATSCPGFGGTRSSTSWSGTCRRRSRSCSRGRWGCRLPAGSGTGSWMGGGTSKVRELWTRYMCTKRHLRLRPARQGFDYWNCHNAVHTNILYGRFSLHRGESTERLES